PDNDTDHWDIIEGQASLSHPGYSGVSLGLLHGSQPDAFVVCHEATRKTISGWDHYSLPSIQECVDLNVQMGKLTNPNIKCVGISVNTSRLPTDEREKYLINLSKDTGLPCVDPLIDGCDAIVNYINENI
ncbi:MAG: NAD-dependent epimerase/dehydratase family protein, partial [Bacteroidota bacterium]